MSFEEICSQTQSKKNKMSKILYALAIGSIMYVVLCMRVNVSYVLSIRNRYQFKQGESH